MTHFSRRRKDARPGELVAAAQALFFERGFAATRLEDVAVKAGVSKGTIYLYFKSKELLFNEVIRTGLAPAVASVAALSAGTARPPREQLLRFLAACKQLMAEAPLGNLLKMLVAEAGNFPDTVRWFNESVERPAKKIMVGIVQAGIASGDFQSTSPEMAADLFLSILCFSALAETIGNLSSPEQFLDYSHQIFTRGLDKISS